MGCSSSTQTHNQGSNRPPTKTAETNGPKKSVSEVSNQITDDIDTIPDQTKLVPLTENAPSANGIPPEEEHAEAEEAIEFEGAETLASTMEEASEACLPVDEELAHTEESTEVITTQDSPVVEEEEHAEAEEAIEFEGAETLASTMEEASEACLPVDEELAQIEESTEVITAQDSPVVEGEIEEAIEANTQEETASEELETKEDETGHPVDGAEPETDTADVEE